MGGKKRGKGRPDHIPISVPGITNEKEKQEKVGAEVDEIDAIFAAKKRKRPVPEEQKGQQSGALAAEGGGSSNPMLTGKKKHKKKGEGEKSLSGSSALSLPNTRKTKKQQDGLAIYTEEELGFNRKDAGGTSLCPFDCECCF